MQVTLQGNAEQGGNKEDNDETEGSAGGFLGLPESDTDLKVWLVFTHYNNYIGLFRIIFNGMYRIF
jgi:hypothetical protein